MITEEQKQKIWKWCKFKHILIDSIPWHKKPEGYQLDYWYANNHWIYPDDSKNITLPDLDLNNLFKYAIPKLTNYRIGLGLSHNPQNPIHFAEVFGNKIGEHGHGESVNSSEALVLALLEMIKD